MQIVPITVKLDNNDIREAILAYVNAKTGVVVKNLQIDFDVDYDGNPNTDLKAEAW